MWPLLYQPLLFGLFIVELEKEEIKGNDKIIVLKFYEKAFT